MLFHKCSSRLMACIILLPITSIVFAQPRPGVKVGKGIMFVKLGSDTTAVQQFEIIGDSIRTTVMRRPGGIQLYKGAGTLFPDGNIKSMQSTVYRSLPTGELQKVAENKLYTTSDSTFIENNANNKRTLRSYAGRGFIANDMDFTTFFMFPYLGFYAPARINDSVTGKQFAAGGFRQFTIKRTGRDEIRVGSNIMGNLKLKLNDDGSLSSIDAIGSSLNFTSDIRRNMDMDSLINAMLRYQQQAGLMGPQTVRDTSRAKIGSALVEIDYWRPFMRGRKIFGAVVPWNRFWRTGANNATQLRITQPVYFNGQKLDSGKYAIFTWPTETGWTFLVNKQATIWGTDYNPDYDILRVPMKVEKISQPVEQLTIRIVPSGDKGRIVIEWENTRASVDLYGKK